MRYRTPSDYVIQVPSLKRFLAGIVIQLQDMSTKFEDIDEEKDLSRFELAVILLEDRRFFIHSGVDFRSIARDLWRMLTFRNYGGSSTIEMQFVRTCTENYARTLRRKINEIILAYFLQFHFSKMQILRAYLQIVYLGTGLKGADSTALRLFKSSSDKLTVEQAHFLAAMMVYPRPRNPTKRWHIKVQQRTNYGKKLSVKYGAKVRDQMQLLLNR